MEFEHFVHYFHLIFVESNVAAIAVIATSVSAALVPVYTFVLLAASFASCFIGIGHSWCIMTVTFGAFDIIDFIG